MKIPRFNRTAALRELNMRQRLQRLQRARRASLRVLCLLGALWGSAIAGRMMFGGPQPQPQPRSQAQPMPLQPASASELPPPPRLALLASTSAFSLALRAPH